jgi:hypothetical protein
MAIQPVGTAATFQKAGLTYEDHHFKLPDGKYQKSPPKKLKEMYNYLPTDDSPYHAIYHTPQRITISAPPNSLKQQAHALGVYCMVQGRECNGKPMYKHATADLVLAHATKVGENDEEGWIVAKWSTFGVKDHRCLQIPAPQTVTPPIKDVESMPWQEWNGRAWVGMPKIKCRPTYHGFGVEKINGEAMCHNTLSSAADTQRQGKAGKSPGKGRGGSPQRMQPS